MTMLQKRYPALFNIITVGAPATGDSPEHNKLQALFLDQDFQYAFIESVLGKSVYTIAREAAQHADKINRTNLQEASEHSACLLGSLRELKQEREKYLKDAQTEAAKPLSRLIKEYQAREAEIEAEYNEKVAGVGQNSPDRERLERNRKDRLEYLVKPEEAFKHAQQTLADWEKCFTEASQKLSNEEERFAQLESQQAAFSEAAPRRPKLSVEFECGFDVKLRAVWLTHQTVCYTQNRYSHEFNLASREEAYQSGFGYRHRRESEFERSIELKPRMGGRSPGGLARQMKNNGADVLVIGSFESTACTIEQVRGIFGERKIVTLAQIQAVKERGVWPSEPPLFHCPEKQQQPDAKRNDLQPLADPRRAAE
jgi:hypothetical protein